MSAHRPIDIGQHLAADTARAMSRFDRAIDLMAAAQQQAAEGLARRGWREPPQLVTAPQRSAPHAQVMQVVIDGRAATPAELLALGDSLQLQPTERDAELARLAPVRRLLRGLQGRAQ